jgi:hypothetical protein
VDYLYCFPQDDYYMVADPNHANTGLQVKPSGQTPVC